MSPQVSQRWGGQKNIFARSAREIVPHLHDRCAAPEFNRRRLKVRKGGERRAPSQRTFPSVWKSLYTPNAN